MAELFNEFLGTKTPSKKKVTPPVNKKKPEKMNTIISGLTNEMHSRNKNRMTHIDKAEKEKPYAIKKPDRFNFDSESVAKELNSTDDLAKYILMGEILNKPKFRR